MRVDDAIHRFAPVTVGTRLEILGGPNRPPLEASASADLFATAQKVAA